MLIKIGTIIISVGLLVGSLNANNVDKCFACHGKKGEKKAFGKSKIIKDMSQKEIENALHGYKSRTYGGTMKGMMRGQVAGLSDSDITELAKYFSKITEVSKETQTNISKTTTRKKQVGDYSVLEKNSECIILFISSKKETYPDATLKYRGCKSTKYYTNLLLSIGDKNKWNKITGNDICKQFDSKLSQYGTCTYTADYATDKKMGNRLRFYKEYKRLILKREKNAASGELIITDKDIKTIDATKNKISKAEMITLMKTLSYPQMWTELAVESGTQFLYFKYYKSISGSTNYLSIHTLKIPVKSISSMSGSGIIKFKEKIPLTNKKTKPSLNYYPNNPYQEITIFDSDKETGYLYKSFFSKLSKILYVLQKEKFRGNVTKKEIKK